MGGVRHEKKITEFLQPYLAGKLPVSAQIMGSNPEILADLACRCMDCGANSINLNCGCPSKRVISGNAGGGALKDRKKLALICSTIRKKLGDKFEFSVKMRTGFTSPEEMKELIPALADAGVNKFFIHFRTVQEQYLSVPGRLERLQQAVCYASPLPVIINGDIQTVQEGCGLLQQTGAAGIMAARAFMHDPWLLARFEDPDVPSPEEGRVQFFRALEKQHVSGGNRIELAKMIWGAKSEEFLRLLASELVSK